MGFISGVFKAILYLVFCFVEGAVMSVALTVLAIQFSCGAIFSIGIVLNMVALFALGVSIMRKRVVE